MLIELLIFLRKVKTENLKVGTDLEDRVMDSWSVTHLNTARLRRKADFEVWTYDSDNSTRIKCFMQVDVVLCALRQNKLLF